MKIAYLGSGTWGFALTFLLASKGYEITLWSSREEFAKELQEKREHPKLKGAFLPKNVTVTADMKQALEGAEIVIESVTASGIRPVFEKAKQNQMPDVPVILTSKGIEQKSGLLLTEVVVEVFGKEMRHRVGYLSGPSHAEEVVRQLPTSVVCSAYDAEVMQTIQEIFTTPLFRVYPNSDLMGVAIGGAMKNVMAIACGISDGLGFGDNTKAALMTRGLHEIRKLAIKKGALAETLNGLSGMGDLCVTCLSTLSRNYAFGRNLASGLSIEEAKAKVGMVVEGVYTCVSAKELGEKEGVPLPITEAVYSILYQNIDPKDAVKTLLQRAIKEEHL